MRVKAGLVTAAVAVVVAAAAAPAGAVVAKTPNGPVGYLPLNGQAPTPKAAARRDALGNLDYHGGPVMPSNTEFAIFWAPAGFSFPAGYEAGIVQYMKDVATDSGLPTNVYSVGTQYTDNTGQHAAYKTTFGADLPDTTPYPSGGCPLYDDSNGNPFSVCLSDQNISNEVDSFVASHGLPRGLTNEYFVFLPPGVGSCFPDSSNSTGFDCFDREFCAYHSNNTTGGATLYADEGFTPIDPLGCGAEGNYPNGHANGGIDDELSSLSHEANETITDPLGTGWWNNGPGPMTGMENGDQCRNTSDDFGALLGGTPGVNGFNQVIGGRHYILQQEWSNAANGCEQYYRLGGATYAPFKAKVGRTVTFSARIRDMEGGHLHAVLWNFGDGHSAAGKRVTHTYRRPGKFKVSTLLTNNTGLSLFGVRKIKIKPRFRKAGAGRVAVRLAVTR
jgi:hypothetical protein